MNYYNCVKGLNKTEVLAVGGSLKEEWLKTTQIKKGSAPLNMAQRMYHESGQDGRSVLGMLAVQVEKDPKTGATIVRSVTPVSAPNDPQMTSTIFDDGRKSIHAVGGTGAQPSSEELGQILSVIDGVGMKAILEDVKITPTQKKVEESKKVPEVRVTSKENNLQIFEEEVVTGAKTVNNTDVRKKTVAVDSSPKVEVTEGEMLCEGPVTMVFMGYSDGPSEGEAMEAEEHVGMLTAERVIITEEGEELVLGQESTVPPQKALDKAAETVKESPDTFQDIPLDGKSEQAPEQREEGEKGLQTTTAEGQGKPKRKTCQCCVVM